MSDWFVGCIGVNLSRKAENYIGQAFCKSLTPSSPNPFSQGGRGIECLAPLSRMGEGWGVRAKRYHQEGFTLN
ncbi:hypothetical protein [Nostoc sp. 'Peltigera membranacea cyanobiont' 210A]|uniref:hypothetical protein n=1 Tax=Nostoc sp. 'Peltigera membranacea cyanobiont' 210A TaxID=2014529 RepID=UPI00117E9950|nr:hypothetical protein [Nostoc sp. 'Peltigera membranacea cyanobiont' 210A]